MFDALLAVIIDFIWRGTLEACTETHVGFYIECQFSYNPIVTNSWNVFTNITENPKYQVPWKCFAGVMQLLPEDRRTDRQTWRS